MWNKNKSLLLSIIITVVVLVILTVLTVAMPWLLQLYIKLLNRIYTPTTVVLATFYSCVPFGYIVFGGLLKLLLNIRSNNVFTKQNTTLLRVIAWSCFVISLICLAGGLWYMPFIIVGCAIFFIAVIIKVIQSVLTYGNEIKDDNDLTIWGEKWVLELILM